MGNRNRKRKNRREKAQARKYQQKYLERQVDEELQADEFNRHQEKFAKEQRMKQQELLSRAVFVSNVKDLSKNINLLQLHSFFERSFGPVESCTRQRRKGSKARFPPNAQVVFAKKSDADRVLESKEGWLSCPVAYKSGKIRVSHAQPSKELFAGQKAIVDDGLTVAASYLSVGDWCPAGSSMDDDIFGNDEAMRNDQWLETERSSSSLTLRVDLEECTVEIIPDSVPSDDGHGMLRLLEFGYKERFTFRFKDMSTPWLLRTNSAGKFLLIVALKYPPRLGRKDALSSILSGSRTNEFVRTTMWKSLSPKALAQFLSLSMELSEESVRQFLSHRACSKLKKFGVLDFDFEDLQQTRWLDEVKVGWTFHDRFESKLKEMKSFSLAFRIQQLYDQKRLTAYHCLSEDFRLDGYCSRTLFDEIQRLLSEDKTNETRIEEALDSMLAFTTQPCRAFTYLYKSVDGLKSNVPPYCVVVPRLLISPLRTVASGFEVETSNRGIRYFMKKYRLSPDMFARARIADEDETQLFNSELTDDVSSRLKGSLLGETSICGRKYEFLAYSSSQLKENSVWMVSVPAWTSIVEMRRELGDFSSCKTVSKYGARLGQCFSTTFSNQGKNLFQQPSIMPDIFASNGGCHSDGTGLISREFLDQFMVGHPLEPDDVKNVSIIQIRFGGAKGTLTAYDRAWFQKNGSSSNIQLRESMIKFEGNFAELEICSIGKQVPYYLNRHVIFLLDALGVPPETFLIMQGEMLARIDAMMENSDIARDMLSSLMGSGNHQLPLLLKMIDAGLDPQREPFLFDCLSAARNHLLLGLQKKSRILVDDGVVLMGGLDEFGLLPEGTIFFQVGTAPYRGPVMVTKHPVMHPGDVRMLLAIDVPELRHHRNVLLFSQHGERPEADKMSGSDLDGDEFAVTWDPRLFLGQWRNCSQKDGSFLSMDDKDRIFKNFLVLNKSSANHFAVKKYAGFLASSNHEPMDFTPPEATNTKLVPSNPKDHSQVLVDFIIDYMKNSTMGQVATLWLDHAAKEGANCVECLELAKIFSMAVDYPKSGVPAVIPESLSIRRGVPRPHWRERNDCPSYDCISVIGQLYDQANQRLSLNVDLPALMGRKIDRNATILCDIQWKAISSNSDIPDMVFHFLSRSIQKETYPDMLEFAFEESFQYEGQLLETMNKYKLRGEGEICTGFLRKFNKLNKKRQHRLREEVQQAYALLQRRHRQSFFHKVLDLAAGQRHSESDERFFDAVEEENSGDETSSIDEYDRQSMENIKSTVTDAWTGSKDDHAIRQIAFGLAAAYYETTYKGDEGEGAWGEGRFRLFSFPWLVADVIKSCVVEHLDSDE